MVITSSASTRNGVGMGLARRTLGICLLLVVVVLWTASNFLASVCTFLSGFRLAVYMDGLFYCCL